jgi:DNA-binding transcriptional LysR family regulator
MFLRETSRMKLSQETLEQLDGKDFRLLVELQTRGSVSDAAEQCQLGQPAATKRLQRMSRDLDVELLQSAGPGNGRQLTPIGERLADQARVVVKAIELAARELQRD